MQIKISSKIDPRNEFPLAARSANTNVPRAVPLVRNKNHNRKRTKRVLPAIPAKPVETRKPPSTRNKGKIVSYAFFGAERQTGQLALTRADLIGSGPGVIFVAEVIAGIAICKCIVALRMVPLSLFSDRARAWAGRRVSAPSSFPAHPVPRRD